MSERFVLCKKPNNNRRKERPEVDAHVEDREARVASLVLVPVQLTYHRADVRLQKPSANGNQHQPGIEGWQAIDRHRIVAAGDNDAAYQHGAPSSQESVSQPPA